MNIFLKTVGLIGFLWLWFVSTSLGQRLPKISLEETGLSSSRLDRIRQITQEHIDRNQIAGAVMLIARKGKIAYLESFGMMDREAGKKMRNDAIFRIASMTKSVTSVAVMMLYGEGRFLLNDPISKYIPEFKNMQVIAPAVHKDSSFTLIPAKSEITIRQLLTHTSGISYRFLGVEPLASLYKKAGISDGLSQTEGALAENIKRLAKLPLLHHPGEKYSYGLSTDVLGFLIEVVSGTTLDEFFRKRIFAPLKMQDTHFFLPEAKLPQLAAVYTQSPAGGITRLRDEPVESGYVVYSSTYHYRGPQTYFSGGAGLVSTISDYARFLQMLLNGGELDGARLLDRKTVELMTTNHVGDLRGPSGYGFGFAITRDVSQSGTHGSVGSYRYSGFFYTEFIVDPKEQLIAIFMAQLYPTGGLTLGEKFLVLAYQAIAD